MDKLDRVATIGSSILTQAEKESRALIDQANGIRERELRAAEEKIIAEMGELLQKESAHIRHEARAAVSSERTRAREALLRRRDDYSKLVFSGVTKLLADYTRTPDYPRDLLREIEAFRDAYDHSATTVYLRADDMAHAAAVEQLLPGCRVEADEAIRIGGWRLSNTQAGIRVDQSFETRLRDQKDWYLEHCNLEVT